MKEDRCEKFLQNKSNLDLVSSEHTRQYPTAQAQTRLCTRGE
jgi:hypothetical protein